MTFGQDQPEPVVEEDDPLQLGVRSLRQGGVVVDQRDVELAVVQPGKQRLQVVIENGQPDSGSLVAEPGQGRWHERRQGGREAAEPESAGPPANDLGELLLGVLDPGEQRPAVPRERMAGLGERGRPTASLDERDLEMPLQGGHVLAHRRLGQPQLAGGGGERAVCVHRAQDPDAAQVIDQFH